MQSGLQKAKLSALIAGLRHPGASKEDIRSSCQDSLDARAYYALFLAVTEQRAWIRCMRVLGIQLFNSSGHADALKPVKHRASSHAHDAACMPTIVAHRW